VSIQINPPAEINTNAVGQAVEPVITPVVPVPVTVREGLNIDVPTFSERWVLPPTPLYR
jgi:hypothetical protein